MKTVGEERKDCWYVSKSFKFVYDRLDLFYDIK